MDIHSPASDNIDQLRRIADANGVATGFWDWYGNWVGVGAPTLLKVLGALGLPLNESSTVGDVDHAMQLTEEREWRRTLPPTFSCFSPSSATGAGVELSATGSACGAALSSTESGPSTAWAAMGCAATQAVRATDMAASFSFLFVMIDGSFQMVSSLLRITTVPYNGHVSRHTILLPLYHFLVQVVKKKCVETHDL